MLTAPTWTYSAAGGPNPFIVPARGGFVGAAINTESGATVVGLGRRATRFARPLRLETRGVAIFAQPAPGTLPERVWAVGYSTTAGVAPRLFGIDAQGEVTFDVARPEVAWREGRAITVTELADRVILHLDDRHLVMDASGQVVANVNRPGSDAAYAVERGHLHAYDGRMLVAVDLQTGTVSASLPCDATPGALRVDPWGPKLGMRIERTLVALDLDGTWGVRALVGGLVPGPSALDANLRVIPGPPLRIECLDDDGGSRWTMAVPGATGVGAQSFFAGGEVLLSATHAGGDRVMLVRDGAVLLERPRAGTAVAVGTLARLGDRVALVLAPGGEPGPLVEFHATIEVAHVRGGGAIAWERATAAHVPQRMVCVGPAGATVIDATESGGGARWAAASEGLVAVPRTNAARVDLYDTGAPA